MQQCSSTLLWWPIMLAVMHTPVRLQTLDIVVAYYRCQQWMSMIDAGIEKAIRPAFTVYTKTTTIDPSFAPKEALLAFYNGDESAVDATLKARDEDQEIPSAQYLSSRGGIMNPNVPIE